jgi:hypothetical protein
MAARKSPFSGRQRPHRGDTGFLAATVQSKSPDADRRQSRPVGTYSPTKSSDTTGLTPSPRASESPDANRLLIPTDRQWITKAVSG